VDYINLKRDRVSCRILVHTATKPGFRTRQANLAQLSDYELLKKEFDARGKLISIAVLTNEASLCLVHWIYLWIGKFIVYVTVLVHIIFPSVVHIRPTKYVPNSKYPMIPRLISGMLVSLSLFNISCKVEM
jgi:hypothetical protein